MERTWGRWCTSPRKSYSLATSPLRRPVTAPWHRRCRWHSQSICHSGAHENSCSSFFPAPPSTLKACIHPLPHVSSVPYVITPTPSPLFPPLTSLIPPSLPIFFLFTLMTPHFWSPEPFQPLHPQSLPSSCDLPISFCSALYSWIWFTQPPLLFFLLFAAPFLSLCRITLDIYSAAISPGEMKIDSPSSNCYSLAKEKGEAVSWALSKAVHPSPFEVGRQGFWKSVQHWL